MRLRLSILLCCLVAFLGLSAPANAQTRAIQTSGVAGGNGGHLEITIETFGTLVVNSACPVESHNFSIPIPNGATCQIMTQAIYDALSVGLAGIFEVTESIPLCTVFMRRENGDPECTYFETKVRGDWQGMTFRVIDDPTPVQETSWSWLKHSGWREALRGNVVAPRR